jgi:ABC-2 type transport system permease protein
MNSFWTVVGFTARNKLKAKSFLITTLIIAIVISIGANIPFFINKFGGGDSVTGIGYIQAGGASSATGDQLKAYFEQQEKKTVELVAFEDKGSEDANEKQLKEAIADKKIKGYLTFGDMTESGFPEMTYKSEKLLEVSTTSSLQGALLLIRQTTILQDAGLTQEQLAQLNAPIKIGTVQISATEGAGSVGEGKSSTEQGVNMGLIYFIIILLFMAVMISGQLIASEITSEKSSRVMEILITSVAPIKQMFGKIFGVFVVVVLQIIAYVAVIFINASLPHNKDLMKQFNIDLSQIDPGLMLYSVLFFLTGFFLFATMFAAVGSVVSRTEDLGQAIMPITMISLAGFYISIFSISTPDSMLVKITSFIPLFSPFVMMLRLGLTDPPMWEVLTSIGLLFVAIYLSVWLSAKIYRVGVLMYGKRPSLKEIVKAMKAYRV